VTTTASTTGSPGVGFRSERGPVLAALMLSTGLVALDSTIIATAVPSVVKDLGGFSQFPWLFSIYLLAQAVTVPLCGKFADVVGRRPLMFLGIATFLLGSVLCGFAWSMPSLIAFRAVQGIGAGAVAPMSMTIVGDLYTVAERARVQGYLASVWGIAAVVGPTLGGMFSDYLSWRWIFFVNLPLGAVAWITLSRRFKENVVHRDHAIDWTGAVLLTAGCSLAILGLLEGGVSWGWGSVTGIVVLAGAGAALVAFVLAERRAAEPILPLWVFGRRVLVGGNLVSLGVGALLIGLTSYVPTYAQGVLGKSAVVAGFALAALTVGWPLSSSVAGRLYLRIGFRNTSLLGSVLVVVGTALALLLGTGSSIGFVAFVCFLVGAGLGLVASPTLVAVQSVVGWDRRGVVTGANMFCRSMGSAVGAAVFGAVANASLTRAFAHPPGALAGAIPRGADAATLAINGRGPARSSAAGEFVRHALNAAAHDVFIGIVLLAVVGIAFLLLMPHRTEQLEF
jgi:EmrB/QacA subfamily drug resistance transporter